MRKEGVQYAGKEEQRAIANNFRKNEVAVPKWKRHSVVVVSVGEIKADIVKNNIQWNVEC